MMMEAEIGAGRKDVDWYLEGLPQDVRAKLGKVRETIRKAVQGSEEAMSYGVPAFKKGGRSVLYAAFKEHIGLYPTPRIILLFKEDLEGYDTSKGTIRFPLDKPIPYALIGRIARRRLDGDG